MALAASRSAFIKRTVFHQATDDIAKRNGFAGLGNLSDHIDDLLETLVSFDIYIIAAIL